jgi:hypothetical protein
MEAVPEIKLATTNIEGNTIYNNWPNFSYFSPPPSSSPVKGEEKNGISE